MNDLPAWLNDVDDGVALDVIATPRASRDRLVGEHDGRLRVQLAAPPVDGAANDALLRAVAGWLNLPRGAVELASGQASRRKRLVAHGLRAVAALERLRASGLP